MARRFDSTADFVDTGLGTSKGSGDNFSFLAWVKLNASPVGATQLAVVGHEAAGTGNGFEVYIIATPDGGTGTTSFAIRFRPGNGHGDSNSSAISVDLTTVPQCIAIVNDKSGADTISFYAGATVDTLALVSSTTGRTLQSTPGSNQYIGARKNSGGSVVESLTGTVDKCCLFYDQVLTLDQLKEVAPCDSEAHADIATYYYKMDGTSPEPDSSINNFDASVTGTTVVDDICDVGFEGLQIAKAVQVIESVTNGIAIAKAVQVIEYLSASLQLEETLVLTDDPDDDGEVFTIVFIKYILETLHLADLWRNLASFKILLLETLDLTDSSSPVNVGAIQLITQVFTKPLKFLMILSRRLFFGGEEDGDI
jgi:hypothetical protein